MQQSSDLRSNPRQSIRMPHYSTLQPTTLLEAREREWARNCNEVVKKLVLQIDDDDRLKQLHGSIDSQLDERDIDGRETLHDYHHHRNHIKTAVFDSNGGLFQGWFRGSLWAAKSDSHVASGGLDWDEENDRPTNWNMDADVLWEAILSGRILRRCKQAKIRRDAVAEEVEAVNTRSRRMARPSAVPKSKDTSRLDNKVQLQSDEDLPVKNTRILIRKRPRSPSIEVGSVKSRQIQSSSTDIAGRVTSHIGFPSAAAKPSAELPIAAVGQPNHISMHSAHKPDRAPDLECSERPAMRLTFESASNPSYYITLFPTVPSPARSAYESRRHRLRDRSAFHKPAGNAQGQVRRLPASQARDPVRRRVSSGRLVAAGTRRSGAG